MAYRSIGREGVPPRYFLISEDRKLVKGFPSHWMAKRFAKKHKIPGFVARELGSIEEVQEAAGH
jgi:hypothetical protein